MSPAASDFRQRSASKVRLHAAAPGERRETKLKAPLSKSKNPSTLPQNKGPRGKDNKPQECPGAKLSKGRRHYEELANSIADVFFAMDKDLNYTFWNKASEVLTGIEAGDAVGKSLYDLFPDIRGTKVEEVYLEVLRTGKPRRFDFKYRLNGRLIFFEINAYPSLDGLSVFARDITERKRAEDALQESETKYRNLFELSHNIILLLDRTGNIIDVNPRGQQLTGYPQSELRRMNVFHDLIIPEDHPIIRQVIRAAFKGEESRYEVRWRTKEGKLIYFDGLTVPRVSAQGEVLSTLCSLRNVTEKKMAEEALIESERRFHGMLGTINLIAMMLDMNGDITFCNDFLLNLAGWRREEVIGRSWFNIFMPTEIQVRMREVFSEGMRTGMFPLHYENEIVTRRGERRLILWNNTLLRDAQGNIIGSASIGEDITEYRRLQSEVALRERQLNSFFAGATAGLALLDKDLRYIQINETLADMHGIPAKEHIGRTVREIVPDLVSVVEPILQKVLTTGEPVLNTEVTGETQSHPGIQRHWMESFFPLTGMDGGPEGVGSIVVEITERKRAEETLQRYAEQLKALSYRLVEVQEEERRYVAKELHDEVAQVLTGLKFSLESLGNLPDLKIKDELGKMQELLSSLLEKVRDISLDLRPSMLDDLGLLPTMLWHVDRFTSHTNVRVAFKHNCLDRRFRPEIETTVYRVVQEALTNIARHASVSEAEVRILIEGDTLLILVEDKGVGFGPEAVITVKNSVGLSGMGERLRLLGGELRIESSSGSGTRLRAEIPIRDKVHIEKELGE